MAMAPKDMLSMSDDDFAQLNGPPEADASGDAGAGEVVDKDQQQADDQTDKDQDGDKQAEVVEDDDKDGEDGDKSDENAEGDDDTKTKDEDQSGEDGDDKSDKQTDTKDKKPEPAKDEKADGDKKAGDALTEATEFMVPTSFKANGKTIEIKSPEEALKLMQMGANYTRKLQELQPSKKLLQMLQNNDLLDEGKLSFLIDLDKKDPEAIKKLIVDSGINPLDIDTTESSTYRPGNHGVSDQETQFRSTMEELISSGPEGKETVAEIHDNWDQTSKDVLWDHPELMTVFHEQRATGVYDLITAEVDRRKTIGKIPPNTPFIEAYKLVGDEFAATQTNQPNGIVGSQTDKQQAPNIVGKRAAVPPSKVKDGEKANAASPTRGSPKKSAGDVKNPLAMSDDDFLKQFDGRL